MCYPDIQSSDILGKFFFGGGGERGGRIRNNNYYIFYNIIGVVLSFQHLCFSYVEILK